MRVRYLGAVALAVLGAGGAGASQITLTMDTSTSAEIRTLAPRADGARVYGWFFATLPVQAFTAAITGDDGLPVRDTCLQGDARVELLDRRLQVRAAATCTGSDGAWTFVLSGASRIARPDVLTAQLLTPATTHDGRALAPAASNPVAIVMAPRITNTMPARHRGATYPLTGYVTMPATLRARGVIELHRRRGVRWVLVERKRTDSSGRFRFVVAYGSTGTTTTFRYRFVPPADEGWVAGTSRFAIAWV